ncbi:MAG: hypothetical protein CR982_04770 [Candidatus Cloacimonadota bacterium]|nr:MAG: hypothetical protein CR982_04770 [Candidatus Cloacimonadota bacterium]PIE81761.1 MAG: hypothetical protein CSA15_00395 [Candidatus Delongbacteria bacterium]
MEKRKDFIDKNVMTDFDDDQFFSEMIDIDKLNKGEIDKEEKKRLDILRKARENARIADV